MGCEPHVLLTRLLKLQTFKKKKNKNLPSTMSFCLRKSMRWDILNIQNKVIIPKKNNGPLKSINLCLRKKTYHIVLIFLTSLWTRGTFCQCGVRESVF